MADVIASNESQPRIKSDQLWVDRLGYCRFRHPNKSSQMMEISLGQRIHELRNKAGLSLRKLADQIGISSPFLSDIELGRRFPSEEILAKLADALDVSPDELKQYDTRGPIADLKRLVDSDPKLGFAFRTVVEKIKNGELTAEDIIAKLSKRKSRA